MSMLRRYKSDCNLYFITNVTYNRLPILVEHGDLLMTSMESIGNKEDVIIIAYTILPEHLHLIMDVNDFNISTIMQRIKMSFGALYRGRMRANSGRIWQHRFWDHIIRSQEDFNRHLDYIHYNPVKHGYAKSPFEWEYSSIHDYLDYYPEDWGRKEKIGFEGNFGE